LPAQAERRSACSSARLTPRFANAIGVQANVAKKVENERLFAKTQQVFGEIDILVNNAGIDEYLPLEDITEDHFHS
jgi:NAD(P)-dependent dehydrogenase (short-subunit alcohol dehydrogenase family)